METQQQTLKVSLKGNFYLVWHIVFHSLVHTYNRALDYKSVSLAHPSSSMRANNASFLLCSACASTSLLLLKIIATILTVAGHSFAWPHLILFCYLSCVACIIINSPVVDLQWKETSQMVRQWRFHAGLSYFTSECSKVRWNYSMGGLQLNVAEMGHCRG